MSEAILLDEAWLARHPLPGFDDATNKSTRGQILIVGGGAHAPAAPLLTAEAALRAGCGRARVGVGAAVVPVLAGLLPEAGWIGLPTSDGDIAPEAVRLLAGGLSRADAILVGPGMGDREVASAILAALLACEGPMPPLLLDAAACACAGGHTDALAALGGKVVLTPHPGEMADLLSCDGETVEADCAATALDASRRMNAIVALRSAQTFIAAPDGRLLRYSGGGIGLATGGSGDVGVGIIGGLLARGTDPFVAAAWGTWVHGEAGRALGEPGFLAREILPLIPALIARPRSD